MPGAAVVDVSISSGNILVSGAESIIVNNHPLGYLSSVNSKGVAVVAGSTTVKAENKQAARVSDAMADGGAVTTGSEDVFIGDDIEKDTPVGRAMSNGDERGKGDDGNGQVGSLSDINKRTELVASNKYGEKKRYPDF